MVEFISEPQKPSSPILPIITAGLLIIILGGIAFYSYRQRGNPTKPAAAIFVPGLLKAPDSNFEYYKTQIRIENVGASLGISLSNSRTAFISGILLNNGDRTLEALQLHIILYDIQGKISKERTAFILRPGPGLHSLAPLEKRAFNIGVDSVERDWNPKLISYEITGLKYH
jgi:hypothetical protein